MQSIQAWLPSQVFGPFTNGALFIQRRIAGADGCESTVRPLPDLWA